MTAALSLYDETKLNVVLSYYFKGCKFSHPRNVVFPNPLQFWVLGLTTFHLYRISLEDEKTQLFSFAVVKNTNLSSLSQHFSRNKGTRMFLLKYLHDGQYVWNLYFQRFSITEWQKLSRFFSLAPKTVKLLNEVTKYPI